MHVTPYLFFDGRCEEALAFYETVFGATRGMTMLFRESPDGMPEGMLPAGWDDKIMHAEITVGDTQILVSDGMREGGKAREGMALAVSVKDAAEVDQIFQALLDGGTVEMPLSKTFFSERFGGVADKFGVSWMVLAA